jgi:predicted PurR-regulated permease PerM
MTRPNPSEPPQGVADRDRRGSEEPRMRPMALFRWGVFASLGVVATIAAVFAVYTARTVLIRAAIALFIAISLDPAVRFLVRRGVRRGLAVTIIFVIALALVAGFLISVIPAMVTQFRALTHDLPGYLAQLSDRSSRYRQLSDRYNLTAQIQKIISSAPSKLGTGLLGLTGRIFGALFSTLTVLVLTIYFMADLPRLRHGLVRLFPRARRAQFGRAADIVIDKVGAYMIGNILISLVAGLASFVCFAALGVPFSVPLAFVVALTDLIPMIGASLGAVIAVALTLFSTDLWPTTVLVAIFFVVYQQLENYLIAPRILRSTVNLNAAAVLMAGLIGATALGLVGALMAIPVAAALKVVLAEELQARDAAEAKAADTGSGVSGMAAFENRVATAPDQGGRSDQSGSGEQTAEGDDGEGGEPPGDAERIDDHDDASDQLRPSEDGDQEEEPTSVTSRESAADAPRWRA